MDHHQSVQVYLPVDDADKPIPFLSIPRNDIQRLSIRPFKWIRFVMFSIVGARGNLFEDPGGLVVDYTSTSLGKDRYYYKPSGGFAFVDPDGLNDRKTTTTSLSGRTSDFRACIMARDAHCVFTSMAAGVCDAAHIIPRSKGDEYIEMVIAKRLHLYDPSERPTISGIDDMQNGIFLNAVLYRSFGNGSSALLKTPNFAMASTDIPRIERGSTHGDHITLHHLKVPEDYDPVYARLVLDDEVSGRRQLRPSVAVDAGLHVDALFEGTTDMPIYPPAIILDFAYGVAAYRHWKCGPVHDVVNDYTAEHYKSIPPRPHDNDNIEWGDDPDNAPGHVSGDANDPEYRPPERKKKHSRQRGNELAVAMDEMNIVLMRLSGTTPAKEAEKREKRIEEEELRAREAGRMKVMEWRKSVRCL